MFLKTFPLILLSAEFLGLPFVPPFYGSQNANFEKGVNFAVGGATALEHSFLVERGINLAFTNVSLGVQLQSFKDALPSLCGSPSGVEVQRFLLSTWFVLKDPILVSVNLLDASSLVKFF